MADPVTEKAASIVLSLLGGSVSLSGFVLAVALLKPAWRRVAAMVAGACAGAIYPAEVPPIPFLGGASVLNGIVVGGIIAVFAAELLAALTGPEGPPPFTDLRGLVREALRVKEWTGTSPSRASLAVRLLATAGAGAAALVGVILSVSITDAVLAGSGQESVLAEIFSPSGLAVLVLAIAVGILVFAPLHQHVVSWAESPSRQLHRDDDAVAPATDLAGLVLRIAGISLTLFLLEAARATFERELDEMTRDNPAAVPVLFSNLLTPVVATYYVTAALQIGRDTLKLAVAASTVAGAIVTLPGAVAIASLLGRRLGDLLGLGNVFSNFVFVTIGALVLAVLMGFLAVGLGAAALAAASRETRPRLFAVKLGGYLFLAALFGEILGELPTFLGLVPGPPDPLVGWAVIRPLCLTLPWSLMLLANGFFRLARDAPPASAPTAAGPIA